MSILSAYLKNRRVKKLCDQIQHHTEEAEICRQLASKYSLEAYELDMMSMPLTWGRIQNEANQYKLKQRDHLITVSELAARLKVEMQ